MKVRSRDERQESNLKVNKSIRVYLRAAAPAPLLEDLLKALPMSDLNLCSPLRSYPRSTRGLRESSCRRTQFSERRNRHGLDLLLPHTQRVAHEPQAIERRLDERPFSATSLTNLASETHRAIDERLLVAYWADTCQFGAKGEPFVMRVMMREAGEVRSEGSEAENGAER